MKYLNTFLETIKLLSKGVWHVAAMFLGISVMLLMGLFSIDLASTLGQELLQHIQK